MTNTHRTSAAFSAAAVRRRRLAIGTAVGLTVAAAVPAVLMAEPAVKPLPQPAYLSIMGDDPKVADSAEALAQGLSQLAEKQYEEALATLQQARADELSDEQKAQFVAALNQAEGAANARKAARAAFEQGEQALAAGDNLAAITHYAAARGNEYADAATVEKASTQTALAVDRVGDLKGLYAAAKEEYEAGSYAAARPKFAALDAVGFNAGLFNKKPAEYVKLADEQLASGPAATPVVDAAQPAVDPTPMVDAQPAAEPSAADRAKMGRDAYVAGRDFYARGDILAAKAQFQRAVDLGYKNRMFEAGPVKMLAEIQKKEDADARRAALAALDAAPTAVASAADAVVADAVTPSQPAIDAQPMVDSNVADARQPTPAEPAPTEPAEPIAPAAPEAVAQPTTVQPAAPADTSLQATAEMERIRRELNVERARAAVTQGDQARAGARYQDAIAAYDQALSLDPTNTAAQEGRRLAMTESGRDPTKQDILVNYGGILEVKRQNLNFVIQSALEEARLAREAGNYDTANTAVIKAQVARDTEPTLFTQEQLADIDASIRGERQTIASQREAALARQAEIDRNEAIQIQSKAAEQQAKRQRETVAAWTKEARQLSAQGRYEDAVKIVDQILVVEPRNDFALGVRPLLEDRRQLDRHRRTAEKINRDLVDVLNQAEEARVPIPDLLTYPMDWPDINARRAETLARERGADNDADGVVVLNKQLLELRFDGVPFADVIEFLTDTTNANIFVNWAAIEGAGVDKSAPITTRLRNVKLSKVLDIVLANASAGVTPLAYTVDEGVITISTQEDLSKNVKTRTYDIRDLLVRIPNFDNAPTFNLSTGGGGGGGTPPISGSGDSGTTNDQLDRDEIVEQIIQLIIDTIASDTWKVNGGSFGAVSELGGQLIVTQTPENQSAIAGLLEKLRETRAIQVNVEARFLTVQRNFLEEIGVDFDFQFNVDYGRWPSNGTGVATGESDFSPVMVRNNSVGSGAGGIPTGFTSPGQLVTGLSSNLGQEAQGNAYGLSTSVGAYLDDFRASLLLRAVQLGQHATTLTAPKLTLFNGQRAYVVVSTEQAYVSDLNPIVGQQAVGYDPTIEYVYSGVVLTVQATVSADRKYVTMTVEPSLSRLVALRQFATLSGQTTGGDTGNITSSQGIIQQPEREITQIKTTVSVPDRGTLLLGGQTIMGEVERESGVPVLSKIPFLKRLFTNRGTAKDEQILLILIKPTIIIQREVEQRSFPLLETQ